MNRIDVRFIAAVAVAIMLICSGSMAAQSTDKIDVALVEAIRIGDEKAAREALDAGADPNASVGTRADDSTLCMATAPGRSEFLRLLLDHGASVDKLYINGGILHGSPLACAISRGNNEAFDALIRAGATPDLGLCPECDPGMDTRPLEIATANRSYDLMWRLVELGAVSREGIETLVFSLENSIPIGNESKDPFRAKLIAWLRDQGFEVTPKTRSERRPRPR